MIGGAAGSGVDAAGLGLENGGADADAFAAMGELGVEVRNVEVDTAFTLYG